MTGHRSHSLELSIVVVTHNSRDYVRNCLESLQHAAGEIDHEVIVVDNASQDETREIVRDEFPAVRLIHCPVNSGLAYGNNQGIVQSRGKYILLLNPDTMVPRGALAALLRQMKLYPAIGLLGCRLLNGDRTLQQSFGFEVSCFNEMIQKLFFNLWENYRWRPVGWVLERLHSRKRDVAWVKGACMMVCRQAVFDAELMDENFFMYMEDADLCLRIRQSGWKVCYTPEAEIIHFGGGSARSNPSRCALEHRRSQLHYYKKNLGQTQLELLKVYLGFKMKKNMGITTFKSWVGWGSQEQLSEQKELLKEVLSLIQKYQ